LDYDEFLKKCFSVGMATLFGQPMDGSEKHSIVDDFMYGSNVASSHVYIRLGIVTLF